MADKITPSPAISHEIMNRLYLAVRTNEPKTSEHDQVEIFSQESSSTAERTVTTVPTRVVSEPLVSIVQSGCAPFGALSHGSYLDNYYLESITQVSAIQDQRPYAVKVNLKMISSCRDSTSPPVDARCAVTFTEGLAPAIECASAECREDYYSIDLLQVSDISLQILQGLEMYRNSVLQSQD